MKKVVVLLSVLALLASCGQETITEEANTATGDVVVDTTVDTENVVAADAEVADEANTATGDVVADEANTATGDVVDTTDVVAEEMVK